MSHKFGLRSFELRYGIPEALIGFARHFGQRRVVANDAERSQRRHRRNDGR
jgi:hypothetical protein